MAMHSLMAISFTCDLEVDFLRMMIPHHSGAIKMCEVLQNTASIVSNDTVATSSTSNNSTDPHSGHRHRLSTANTTTTDNFLASLCQDIESSQSIEMAEMVSWLSDRGISSTAACNATDVPIYVHDGMSMGCGKSDCFSTTNFIIENVAMYDGMAIEYTCDHEVDFVRGMIAHHDGAVKMCEVVGMTLDLDPFIQTLCLDITKNQTDEVIQMTAWLQEKGITDMASCEQTIASGLGVSRSLGIPAIVSLMFGIGLL